MGDVVAAGTPIILVHGLVDNRSIFTLLRRALRRRGFGRVITLNYSPFTQDVRQVAQRLADARREDLRGDRLRAGPRHRPLARRPDRPLLRAAAGRRRPRAHALHARRPARGHRSPPTCCRRRWSASCARARTLMHELAEPAPGLRTRFVAFWSDLDQLVVPKRSARIDHPDLSARNVLLRGVGHMSLPIDRRVVREIADAAGPPRRRRRHRHRRRHLDRRARLPAATARRLRCIRRPEAAVSGRPLCPDLSERGLPLW